MEVIKAISEELCRTASRGSFAGTSRPCRSRAVTDPSLAYGSAGLSIFYASLADTGLMASASKCALAFLSRAVDLLAADPHGPSLFGGFTGTAWAVCHLEGRFFEANDGDPNEAVDQVLLRLLRRSPWRGEFNLVSGLVGFGVYALERLPRSPGIECLKRVVDHLDEIAEHGALGATWFTAPRHLSVSQREECPNGHYNLGLSHGAPGVIALLGRVCGRREEALGHTRLKARDLLARAVPWLLAQQPPNRSFPCWTGPDVQPGPARLGWCYGDLGIAVALLAAARGADDPVWEREALKIAHRAARRSVEKSGVVDCGLCRGAAGVAHLFNRLYQATGDEVLKDAARGWFARTVEMWQAGLPEAPRRNTEFGILEGAAGVALALLAAISSVEPAWDRVMLASIERE